MTELDETFDRIVPAFSDAREDWADVLRRAGVRPVRSRRPLTLAAAVALAAVLLVTPALGLRGDVASLFGGRPPRVGLPKAADRSTVRVLVIPVTSTGRVVFVRAALWKGHDGVCYVFAGIESGCATRGRHGSGLGYGPAPRRPGRWLVRGSTFDADAAAVELRYTTGRAISIRLVRAGPPIAEAFFAADVPAPRRAATLLTRDAGGSVISRERLGVAPPKR
jgi:hypothetical protein